MLAFDVSITWRDLEKRLECTTSPRRRHMLQTVIDHAKAEAAGSVDGLMATLSADPRYHFGAAAGTGDRRGTLRYAASTRASSPAMKAFSSPATPASSSTTTP